MSVHSNPNRLTTPILWCGVFFFLPFFTVAQCIEGNCFDGEGTFVYENGNRYVGLFRDGKPQGEGALYYPNGNRYLGPFANGKPHGKGVLIAADGSRRKGVWSYGDIRIAEDQLAEWTSRGGGPTGCISGDCQDGQGTYLSAGGAIYVGQFHQGAIDGQGICYYPDGSKYQGEWHNRYPQGYGTKTWPDGRQHTGRWERGRPINEQGQYQLPAYPSTTLAVQSGCLSGNCENGQGVYAYVDGSRYEGYFFNGQPHGQGVFYYPNGDIHRGQFVNGLPHGQGIRKFADGRQQGGQWDEGTYISLPSVQQPRKGCISGNCQNGYGTYIFKQGDRYTGTFRNGKPNGHGQVTYLNGDRYEGRMVDGAFSGFGTYYEANVPKYRGQWDGGSFLGNTTVSPAQAGPQVKIWALIIGVSSYRHMPVLRFPDDDAYRLFAFLKSPQGGAIPDERIKILIDEDATRTNITTTMRELFQQAGPDDLVVLYFSGHGLPGAFLPIDYDGTSNLLYHSEVRQILDESNAGYKLCLADACHSGSLLAARGGELPTLLNKYYENLTSARKGTALVMSSKSEETSLESSGLRQGVFSHFLLRGLKGEADEDRDGIVRVQELYEFVEENVRAYTGNLQSPVIKGDYDERMPVAVMR